MTAFEKLLENYWFVREQDAEQYNYVKQNLTIEEQNFIKDNLGYKLISNPYVIKLEKVPGMPQSFMGIQEFSNKLEYMFLCLTLIFLEEKTKGEQFILSNLIDYIQNLMVQIDTNDVKVDFTIYSQRKAMVSVLKFIKAMHFIKLYDGDETKFVEDITNEALYEVTGISKYFVRNFSSDILQCNTYWDIYVKEQLGLEQDKGKERKQRIYRRVFTENVIYKKSDDDQDYVYIKNYRNIINQQVDKMLSSVFEVHKNGAYILLEESKNYKNVFPGNKAISEIILFLNYEIVQNVKNKEYERMANDVIAVSQLQMINLIRNTKEKYQHGWSKEYRELGEEKLLIEIEEYMKQYDMMRYDNNTKQYYIMPICFKIIGKYPKDFENSRKE